MPRDADRHSVLLDGLNIGLPQGSGIATYSRNLTRILQQLGYPVDILYDRDVRHDRWTDDLVLEQRFFAPSSSPVLPRGTRRLYRALSQARKGVKFLKDVVAGASPRRVDSPVVLHRGGLPNHPPGAGIITSGRIFRHAHGALELTGRPLRVRVAAESILHLTSPIPLIARNAPTVLTVHDLIPLRMPYAVVDPNLRFLRTLRALLERVDHVIATSESAKRDLVQIMDVDEARVSVVYPSIRAPNGFDLSAAPALVEEMYGLTPGGYFVFAGAIEPKKNLPRLIEAYLASGARSPLVLVGPSGWMMEEQLEPLRSYEALEDRLINNGRRTRKRERIQNIGWVPAGHLAALMSQARALLFPSMYEGFGLPIIEAMQLGTPVLTGSSSAMAEVAGDAAVLVDPFNEGTIARGIAMLEANADLRSHLSEAGRRNALRFTDETCAEMLANTYRQAGIGVEPVRNRLLDGPLSPKHSN